MDRRERANDLNLSILTAFMGLQGSIWTALPGFIVSFDPLKMVAKVQPTIMARAQDRFGAFSNVKLPILPDVPIIFPGGGGFVLTFPIKPGDECLVIIASRCIDSWWQSGGVQVQAELRMHDLSDGFAFVGPYSQPNVVPLISTQNVELRTRNHAGYVAITPDGAVIVHGPSVDIEASVSHVNITAGSSVTITAPSVTIDSPETTMSGNLTVAGTIDAAGEVTGVGIELSNHAHKGVRDGPNTSLGPINLP